MSKPNVILDERHTQNRVIQLFQEELKYTYLGHWQERENSNVEVDILNNWLMEEMAIPEDLATKAIQSFVKTVTNQSKSLYEVNKEVYSCLRYGIKVKPEGGDHKQTVFLIDWDNPLNNHFGVAEEVTVKEEKERRPDVVLYVNGIAIGIIELKRGSVSVERGIRQNISCQDSTFIQRFFHTIQFVMAGNDSQGLRFGTIKTPEKYYLKWKENPEEEFNVLLDKHLRQFCNRERIIEIMRDFILFDGGVKKVCRSHQYFGVKASQEFVRNKQGGIIWHTQGSGKSLTMVWLASWIREQIPNSRVLIITDRDELDKQILKVFTSAGESIQKAKSGRDLIELLNDYQHSLICSLVHKFGRSADSNYDNFLEELLNSLPADFEAKGDIYVFVDECHRTQSGKLHKAMKKILPKSTFIGFTGTPLLKKDKKKSIEIFGPYIHTYKFDEAVEDKVVLDLRYEAKDVNQHIIDQASIDEWFENATRGLTDIGKSELKKRWGTMQSVLSSKSRLEKIALDIRLDFMRKPRLKTGQGNALLVSGSVYQACQYFQIFQNMGFKECAIITSYEPHHAHVKGEDVGEGDTENIKKYEIYTRMLNGKTTEEFEQEVTNKFINEPGQMKLLIVVDKLLTGFDAPPATYLYIDKKMKDHGLFQAICRVNRLDDESKDYGYIIDYKDLFKSLEKSLDDYTSEAFDDYEKDDVDGLLKDRYKAAKRELELSLEAVVAVCEAVHPKTPERFRAYFVGNPELPEDIKEREEIRLGFYKLTARLIRAYANLSGDMLEAGFTAQEANEINRQVKYYTQLRDDIKLTSGDYVDLKRFEPDMRMLIDNFISADPSRSLSNLEDMTLIELIVEKGEDALDALPNSIKKDRQSVAETMENNVRKVIIEDRELNPVFYDRMSDLLSELIRKRREEALSYEQYLQQIVELTRQLHKQGSIQDYPSQIQTPGKRALFDRFDGNEFLVNEVDSAVKYSRRDGWKGSVMKERAVLAAIQTVLPEGEDAQEVLDLIKRHNEY